MKFAFLVAILASMMSTFIQAQEVNDPDTRSKLIALEQVWNATINSKDTKALESLLDQGFVYVHFDGRVLTKAEVLAALRLLAVQESVTESIAVHVHEGVAIVTGTFLLKRVENGKPFETRGHFLDTWIPKNGGWVCIASQGIAMDPQQAAEILRLRLGLEDARLRAAQ